MYPDLDLRTKCVRRLHTDVEMMTLTIPVNNCDLSESFSTNQHRNYYQCSPYDDDYRSCARRKILINS